MGLRAVLYLRVSTSRQAEKDLSLPDQHRQTAEYCARKGMSVVAEYLEPGASATDDKRPEFQRMIDAAVAPDRPFDVIVVHSFSRFFRDLYQFEFYRRKLEKAGVRIVSITQETQNDPAGNMVRQVINLFDEYQSAENAKHVSRAMNANARLGFWNGAAPPYGYRTVVAELRGSTAKKKLEIEPAEAETVRLIFDLYLQGIGSGPMGIRAIAAHLNAKERPYRHGRRFASTRVHEILTRTAYMGVHYYNRTTYRTRERKPASEWISFPCPAIVSEAIFERAQKKLKANSPKVTPPREVNGPTLLTGLAKCGHCGGGMTLSTGKSGRYRYYACNCRITQGKTACKGNRLPMGVLDDLVLDQFEAKILAPDRMKVVLAELAKRLASNANDLAARERDLRKELRATEARIDRLLDALSGGDVADTGSFRKNLGKHEGRKDELLREIASLSRKRDIPAHVLSPKNVTRFSDALRAKLRDANPAFRKSYLRTFIERVEVGESEVRISGPKSALLSGLAADTGSVPGFAPEWWAH